MTEQQRPARQQFPSRYTDTGSGQNRLIARADYDAAMDEIDASRRQIQELQAALSAWLRDDPNRTCAHNALVETIERWGIEI